MYDISLNVFDASTDNPLAVCKLAELSTDRVQAPAGQFPLSSLQKSVSIGSDIFQLICFTPLQASGLSGLVHTILDIRMRIQYMQDI